MRYSVSPPPQERDMYLDQYNSYYYNDYIKIHSHQVFTCVNVTDYNYTDSWMMDGGGINNTFDENCIINNKSTPFQFCVGNKSWASTGNVHIRFWLSE